MSGRKSAVAADSKLAVKQAKKKQRSFASCFKRDWQLYSLLLIPIAFCFLFKYVPMSWLQIAFKNWKIKDGFFGGDWAGLEIFSKVFHHRNFMKSLRNTLLLNVLDLLVSFPMPIILALLLNEIRNIKFKKVTQTLLYLPHFLSWVIIGGLAYQLFSVNTGVVNALIQNLGGNAVNFLQEDTSWLITYIVIGAWQSMGWGTIIYLASITSVSPELYEAAAIDGAGIWQRIIHIMIPAIKKLAGTLLILQIISVFQIMYEPMVLTKGGPDNASLSLMQLMWQYAFGGSMNYGKASAVAVIVTLILLVMTAIYSYFDRKESDWD